VARVYIPRQLRHLTSDLEFLDVEGGTVGEVLEGLERRFPGVRTQLCDGDRLRAGLAVSADGQICSLGMLQPITSGAELHFLPAIGGG